MVSLGRVVSFAALSFIVAGCAVPGTPPSPERTMIDGRDLVFLTRDGCMNTDTMRARLDDALKGMGLSLNYQFVDLATLKADDARSGYPTPTLLYRNRDVFGLASPTPPFPEPT